MTYVEEYLKELKKTRDEEEKERIKRDGVRRKTQESETSKKKSKKK